jgi:hypothetical protein
MAAKISLLVGVTAKRAMPKEDTTCFAVAFPLPRRHEERRDIFFFLYINGSPFRIKRLPLSTIPGGNTRTTVDNNKGGKCRSLLNCESFVCFFFVDDFFRFRFSLVFGWHARWPQFKLEL